MKILPSTESQGYFKLICVIPVRNMLENKSDVSGLEIFSVTSRTQGPGFTAKVVALLPAGVCSKSCGLCVPRAALSWWAWLWVQGRVLWVLLVALGRFGTGHWVCQLLQTLLLSAVCLLVGHFPRSFSHGVFWLLLVHWCL